MNRRTFLIIFVILVAVIASSLGVAFFFFSKNTDSGVIFKSVDSQTDLLPSNVRDVPNSDQREYVDGDNGYSVKYPSAYRITDQKQNYESAQKFSIPEVSGNDSSKFLEIVDPQRHSSILPHKFSYSLLGTSQINSVLQFDSVVTSHLIPSLSQNGYTFTSEKTKFDGQDAYKIIISSSDKKTRIGIYFIYRPRYIYKVEYAPVDDSEFEKIVSSFKFITVTKDTLSDETLYISAVANKDSTFCDHIRDADIMKTCFIVVRGGPIIDEIPINLSSTMTDTGGSGKMVSGIVSLSTQKGLDSWVSSAITIGKDGWDGISFDAKLVNGKQSQSLLTVYLNASEIGNIDGRMTNSEKQRYTFELPPDTNPGGYYTLTFRLNSFAEGETSAVVSNIAGMRAH